MIISVIISLYSSRIILEALGVEDYGVYNVVGGTVAIVGFLSATMSASTSRFLSIAIAEGSKDNIKSIFNTSTTLHLILAMLILLIGESIGLWFVNSVLKVPSNQIFAVNVVYQLSLLATSISIIQIPYNALIVAHEDMHAFAYLEILNTFLKLGIAYVTLWLAGNKLIIYSILVFSVAIFMRILYSQYSLKKYEESKFSFRLDKRYVKSLASFSGWDILAHLGYTARQQGSSIVLNLFFGAMINAAAGIASTVQGVISAFSGNIVTATRPHIIKTYAKKEYHQFQNLMTNVSIISLLMILVVTVPVLINVHSILRIWLKTVPPYCAQFTVWCLIGGIVSSVSSVYLIGIYALGAVKISSLSRNITYLISLVVIYVDLKLGFSPESVYIIIVVSQIITLINDGVILRKAYSISNQVKLLGKIMIILLLSVIAAVISLQIHLFSHQMLKILSNTIIYLLLFLSSSFFFVLNHDQKIELLSKLHLKK